MMLFLHGNIALFVTLESGERIKSIHTDTQDTEGKSVQCCLRGTKSCWRYTVKRLAVFPSPAGTGMSLTKRSLAGTGKPLTLFYSVTVPSVYVFRPRVQELYNKTFPVGAAGAELTCRASGDPLPYITWRKWSRKYVSYMYTVQLLPARPFPAMASLMSGHIEGGVPFPLTN
jgi:hypothetical protein